MEVFNLRIFTLFSLFFVGTFSENSSFGSGSLFNNILQQVTNEKLEQLKSQQDLMRAHFRPVLNATDATRNLKVALTQLYDAVRDAPIKNMIQDEQTLIDTLRYFIEETERDPSISKQIMGVWVDKLKQEIAFAIRKCEYSYLYGSLLSEWLDAEDKGPEDLTPEPRPATEETSSPSVAKNKEEALQELQELMFTPPAPPFNKPEFVAVLREEVFNVSGNAGHQQLLEQVRQEIRNHFDVSTHVVQVESLRSCIDGLDSEDYVAPAKKTALRQLKENSEVLAEVATLLTNRVRHLHLWNWTAPNVQVSLELRRGLAGQWRAELSEDVITMLLHRYIGVEWAAKFKNVFLRHYDAMWKKAGSDTPEGVNRVHPTSIDGFRNTNYRASLLSELPDSMQEQRAKNPNEYVDIENEREISSDEAADNFLTTPLYPEYLSAQPSAGFSAQKLVRIPRPPPTQQPPIDFRQSFLHVLSTEIKLSHTIRPEQPFLVVQSNFENFHASLLHEPVLAMLEFFHVQKHWLDFFTKFLRTPLEDQLRVRGIPDSHVLGSFFGELALFALDFNINQATGINVQRVQDHFWLWGNDLDKMTKAWQIVEEFGANLGLRVDAKKSGSVQTHAEETQIAAATKQIPGPAPLPQGSVRWAYLQLASSGHFTIDLQAVDRFTDEMKGLLDKASVSTLQYINVYNKYMEFFVRNFGKNALVFGDQHNQEVVDALRKIHEQLFGEEDGNAVAALKTRTGTKLPSEIVDAWLYWPLERGGLGLMNPFLEIMALHHKYEETYNGTHANSDPSELEFTSLLLRDRNNYEEYVRALEERNNRTAGVPGYFLEKVLTFQEYLKDRENGSRFEHWYHRYVKLLERPTPLEPPAITRGGPLANAYYGVALNGDDQAAIKHMQWIYTYYEPQLVRHFGTVKFINTELLPMSMIANIRKSKVKH